MCFALKEVMKNWIISVTIGVLSLGYFFSTGIGQKSWSKWFPGATLVRDIQIQAPRQTLKPSLDRRVVESSLRVLQQSHQIFSESWRLLVGSSAIPSSAMKALSQRLANNSLKNCPAIHDEISFNVHSSENSDLEIALKHNICLPGTSELPLIATLHWTGFESEKNQARLKIEFYPSQLPEGVGESLALLNRRISCDYVIGEEDKIQHMSCQNMGQGISRTDHYDYLKFEFEANQQNLLTVEADHFKNLLEKVGCVSDQPCLKLRVPLNGRIQIVENRKMGRKTPTPVLAVIPTPQQLPGEIQLPGAVSTAPQELALNSSKVEGIDGSLPFIQEQVKNESEKTNEKDQSPKPQEENQIAQQSTGLQVQDQTQEQNQNQTQNQTQNQSQERSQVQNQNQNQSNGESDPALQGLPSENQSGGPSPELQPSVNSGSPAPVPTRQLSGQEVGAVFLPER